VQSPTHASQNEKDKETGASSSFWPFEALKHQWEFVKVVQFVVMRIQALGAVSSKFLYFTMSFRLQQPRLRFLTLGDVLKKARWHPLLTSV
jgi:hypothetical protein